jgi:hypothetical protein
MLDQFLKTGTPTHPQTTRSHAHISHRERDDAYIGTIVQFNSRWRLIWCKNQIQWIIQKKESSHLGYWRGRRYLTTQKNVIETCGSLGLLSEPSKRAVLEALPVSIKLLSKNYVGNV